MLNINPARMMTDLRTLAEFGKHGTGVNRRSLTNEDIAARSWLLERMQAGGLEAQIDGLGNVVGRTPGCKRYLLIGSHTDTVPKGGWLDGAMGVIFGLELARAWVEMKTGGETGIEVVSFNDEEGRFAALLGSSVFCGKRSIATLAHLYAADNSLSLSEALGKAGYADREFVSLDLNRHIAYLEAHIEQGPVLEQQGKTIGIVTEIVGVARAQVIFTGRADHAGTTPMGLRQDAAAALFEFAVEFAKYCRSLDSPQTVWNLGQVRFDPGAYNVVTREAVLGIEYRDGSTVVLDQIDGFISVCAKRCAERHNVEWRVQSGVRTTPAGMDRSLMARIEAAAAALDEPCIRMSSGAGHDAMMFADQIPTGMLFVPSRGGLSHSIAEDTREEDIVSGLKVLAQVVDGLVNIGRG